MIKSKGSELYLDIIKESDGLLLNKIRNKPEIWKWCRQSTLIDDGQQRKWLDKISFDPKIQMFSIRNGSHVMVGVAGLTDIDHLNRRAEFSVYIFPEHQRKKYATDALKLLFKHGFYNLNLNCIWGETFDGNPAAQIFTGIGMAYEGTRRSYYFKDGDFVDAHVFSMLRVDFDSLKKVD